MSTFRTTLSWPPATLRLRYGDHLLSLGSCFAEHIGRRLERDKFSALLNPFGILYDPLSLAMTLRRLDEGRPFEAGDLFQHQGLWHSFAHHGRFSGPDRSAVLLRVNAALADGQAFLSRTDYLLLTLGTAHLFEHRASGQVVANCHKLPAAAFRRRRAAPAEIEAALSAALAALRARRPQLQVILTVSPVRHLRDGLIENQRSKAALLLAVDALQAAHDFVHYFPSYELVLDDLRDYRFFAADMTHPNEVAVDYVWEAFCHHFFEEPTRQLQQKVSRIVQAAAHRPFHPATPEHQRFLLQQLAAIDELEAANPFLDFQGERRHFTNQLV